MERVPGDRYPTTAWLLGQMISTGIWWCGEALVVQWFISLAIFRALAALFLPRCILSAMSHEPSFRLLGGRPLLSQQIVTLAFGAKHIPFGMLFTANDFGVPVIYIG